MINENLKYWLAAVHVDNVTPQQFLIALQTFSDMAVLMTASKDDWLACGFTWQQVCSLGSVNWRAVEKAMRWAEADDCHLIALHDRDYPPLLREISDPPLVLFVRGDKSILLQNQFAIVGSRAVSAYGDRNAREFAAGLSRAGFVITSGMALGVDAASHEAVLDAHGLTVAVMGTGLNRIYPARHKQLARRIIEQGGAWVSEFLLDKGPHAYHFPRRNRIVSGMCRGVLVVEAAMRSGSLVTARHAMEQGRDVFAVPGSIKSNVAHGCHAMIRDGAKLVESHNDILEEFAVPDSLSRVEFSPPLAIMPEPLPMNEQKVYECVGERVTSVDEIILLSGLTAGEVSSILLSLELHGHIHCVAGGYVR